MPSICSPRLGRLSFVQRSAVAFSALVLVALAGCPNPFGVPGGPDPDEGRPNPDSAAYARVLLLDHDVRHVAYWADVIRSFQTRGPAEGDLPADAETPRPLPAEVTYRRFFPHLTPADAEEFDVVVVAAGTAPLGPATRMRLAETDAAQRLLERGKTLVLLPQASQEDVAVGENEWALFNRILEEANAPLRIERGVLFGAAFVGEPPPPHQNRVTGYGTTLEGALGYAWVTGFGVGHADGRSWSLPAGKAGLLRTGEGEITVLAESLDEAYLWRESGGDPNSRIVLLNERRVVAAAAPAGGGTVAVVPKGMLLMSGVTGELSDKPGLDATTASSPDSLPGQPGHRLQSLAFTRGLAAHLVHLAQSDAELKVTVPAAAQPLFGVNAAGFPPRPAGDGEVQAALYPIDDRPVPQAPPAGHLTEQLPAGLASFSAPDEAQPPLALSFTDGRPGRVGYGELPAAGDFGALMQEAEDMDLNALVITMSPERTVTGFFNEAGSETYRERIRTHGQQAGETDVALLVGGYLAQMNASPVDLPQMAGPFGQPGGFMGLLGDELWEGGLHPTFEVMGQVAAQNPGLTAFHLDVELYGGPLHHRELFAFSDTTFATFVDAWPPGEEELSADQMNEWSASERLVELVDHGLLGTYLTFLEDEVAERAASAAAAAHALAPELNFTLYMAGYPDSWFHRGLIRGLGTLDRPVAVMTYEAWTGDADAVLQQTGIPLVHLGGTLTSFWTPADFGQVLTDLDEGSDGFWFLSFDDLTNYRPSTPPFGEVEAYRQAVHDAAP